MLRQILSGLVVAGMFVGCSPSTPAAKPKPATPETKPTTPPAGGAEEKKEEKKES